MVAGAPPATACAPGWGPAVPSALLTTEQHLAADVGPARVHLGRLALAAVTRAQVPGELLGDGVDALQHLEDCPLVLLEELLLDLVVGLNQDLQDLLVLHGRCHFTGVH